MTNASLNDVTEVNFFNQLWGDLGGAECVFQGDGPEFWSGKGLQNAIERSNGSTRGGDDDDFGGGLQISLMDGDEHWADAWDRPFLKRWWGEEHKGVCLKKIAGRVLIYLT